MADNLHGATAAKPVLRGRLFFVNRYYCPDESATSQILTDLARGLAERGFEVHVICSRQLYGDARAQLPRTETLSGVMVHRIATTRFGRARLLGRAVDYASFFLSGGVLLMRLARSGDVLVAKTDPPLLSLLAAPIARFKKLALINWQQDVFPEVASQLGANPLPKRVDQLLRRLRDWSLRSASMNVLVGQRMLEYIASRDVPRERLCVIENWADSTSIQPKDAKCSALRTQLGLAGQFVVGYSGNLGRAHEHAPLLAAASALKDDASVSFLFIGGGVKMEALKTQVDERNLRRVRFLPYRPRECLEDSLAAADVHLVSLIPALEGLIVPSKFYGILAAGRPVVFIGDPDGELARIIRATGSGVVVGTGRGAELASAIRRLQRDDSERLAMSLAARQLLDDRYTVNRGVAAWTALLIRLSEAT
jgi:glycosyltransferase involved in cell wall biosynthesis